MTESKLIRAEQRLLDRLDDARSEAQWWNRMVVSLGVLNILVIVGFIVSLIIDINSFPGGTLFAVSVLCAFGVVMGDAFVIGYYVSSDTRVHKLRKIERQYRDWGMMSNAEKTVELGRGYLSPFRLSEYD